MTPAPPAAPAEPPESVIDHYVLLGDRVPALQRIEAWDRWVAVDDDADAGSASSWEAYEEEARYEVVVDVKNGYVRVRDEGTGGGEREWLVAMFVTASGSRLIGVSASDFEPDATSSEASWLRWEGAAWKDVTAEVAPEIGAGLFLEGGDAAAAQGLLVPIVELPQHGTTVKVRAVANGSCPDGRFVSTQNLSPEKAAAACQVLAAWKYQAVSLAFDKKSGRFEVSERKPR